MSEENEWSVVFYTLEDDSSPVREFLDGLDKKTKARFAWSIERLRVLNVQAREPLVKHLEDKIWELREESQKNIYRLLYFFFTGRQIVFLHGFQKKTQKTPRREIDAALARYKEFLERETEEGE
jgi:phage-related protein